MLAGLTTVWILAVSWTHTVAALRFRYRARRGDAHVAAPSASRVVLLRPLSGDEPGLAERLQNVASVAQVAFCVEDALDSAWPIAERAALALRARGIEAQVVATRAVGPNHKVDQLARGLSRVTGDWDVVVMADSDVALDDRHIESALALLEAPDVGAVWLAPVVGGPVHTLGDRATAAVLSGSLHAFPLLAQLDGNTLVGKLVVLRRRALEAVGGFEALRHHLGEDVELGRRLRAHGMRVLTPNLVAVTAARGAPFGVSIERFARWLTVVRSQRPHLLPSYPLLFAACTPCVLLGVWAALQRPELWGLVLGLLAARAAVYCIARELAHLPRSITGFFADMLLSDAVLTLALLRSLARRPLYWRGRAVVLDVRRRLVG